MEARDGHYYEVRVTLQAEGLLGTLFLRFAAEIVETIDVGPGLLMLEWWNGPSGVFAPGSKLVFNLGNVVAYSVDLIEGEPPNWGTLETSGPGLGHYG